MGKIQENLYQLIEAKWCIYVYESKLAYCQLDPKGPTSVKFESKYTTFILKHEFEKCHLQDVSYLSQPHCLSHCCVCLCYSTGLAPSQWETALLCNDISHWLGESLESALFKHWVLWQLQAQWHRDHFVCFQPVRDDVTLWHGLSLAGCIHKMISHDNQVRMVYVDATNNPSLTQWGPDEMATISQTILSDDCTFQWLT